jgi:hypothetical protein
MSVLGACWHRPILGEKSLFLSTHHMWRKRSMQKMKEKEGKECRRWRKSSMAHADKPSHVRVRVFDMNVMAMSQ